MVVCFFLCVHAGVLPCSLPVTPRGGGGGHGGGSRAAVVAVAVFWWWWWWWTSTVPLLAVS